MNKKNTKLLTILLASALGVSATVGGVLLSNDVFASADTSTATVKEYDANKIFKASTKAEVDGERKVVDGVKEEQDYVLFGFNQGTSTTPAKVSYYERSVALEWKTYDETDGVQTHNFSTTFAFKKDASDEINFDELALVMETEPATATEGDKAINKVVFVRTGDHYMLELFNGETEIPTTHVVDVSKPITIKLAKKNGAEDAGYGEYFVILAQEGYLDQCVGKFTNIAANVAEYKSGRTPLYFEADVPEDKKGVIEFRELNGQSFALMTDKDKIEDTAEPVLVVNNKIERLQLGERFSMDVQAYDVLDDLLSISKEFYQYNPDHTTADDIKYSPLTSETSFKETAYSGGNVFNDWNGGGKEYVSIRYYLSDEKYKDETKVEAFLAWYVEEGKTETFGDIDYIVLDRSEVGPNYTFLSTDNGVNEYVNDDKTASDYNTVYETKIKPYQDALDRADDELYVGTDQYLYLPSLKGLIDDNDGFQNIKFAISFKKQGSDSPSSTTNMPYNEVKLAVSDVGLYEFKIYANADAADKKMKYYVNGNLEELNSTNIWDIDEIPSFTIEVKPTDMKVKEVETTEKKTEKVLDVTYTAKSFNVLGVTGTPDSQYALFMVNYTQFNTKMGANILKLSDLYAVSYEKMWEKAKSIRESADFATQYPEGLKKEDEADFFKSVYVQCLADVVYATDAHTPQEKAQLVQDMLNADNGLFREIAAYDDRISETAHYDEWVKNNKYQWRPENQSFKTVEEGTYLMLASFSNPDVPAVKVSAYRIIVASETADVLPGEDNWLENNLASVILFSIAGVMLIVIIVLLFIKPDKKTLEDVDEQLDEEGEEKAKKSKKEKKSKKDKKD